MKNVFSRNFHNSMEILNGEEFVEKRNQAGQAYQVKPNRKSDPVISNMIWHMVLQFVKAILGILGIITIGFGQDLKNQTLYIAGIICIILAIVLHFYSKNKLQESVYFDKFAESEKKDNISQKEYFMQQGIPEDAKQIEIMYTLYEPENVEFVTYMNEHIYAFREKNNLCFVIKDKKLVFVLEDICSIEKVDKKAALDLWNKEMNFDDGIYKEYQIKSDASIYDQYYITTDYGRGVVIPYYYAVIIRNEYEILVPPYEIDVIQELTGLKVS